MRNLLQVRLGTKAQLGADCLLKDGRAVRGTCCLPGLTLKG